MLISVRPLMRSANARSPRPVMLSIAAASTSMKMMTSQRAKTSAGSFATLAPALARMADLAGVRFQTRSGVPALTRLSAIGSPIAPTPMNPTGAARVTVIQLLATREEGDGLPATGQKPAQLAAVSYVEGVRLPLRNVEERVPGGRVALRTNSIATVFEAV